MTIELNQKREDFEAWLKSLPPEEYAIAGDQCHCWLAKWFESQGFYIWGVFPRYADNSVLGSVNQEVFLDNPEYEDEFDEKDRIDLENWAGEFGSNLDEQYHEAFKTNYVTRDQALELLGAIAA
jgi:hypothetical protein